MFKYLSRSSLTLAALLSPLFVGMTFGQAPKAPPVAESANAYRAKQVLGAKIYIQGDLVIGTVDDLVFNDAGSLEYMIVANEGKLITVPWEAAKFNFEKQTASLSITQDQFKTIPTYTVREYPRYFEPTYRTQAYKWYGLTPRVRR